MERIQWVVPREKRRSFLDEKPLGLFLGYLFPFKFFPLDKKLIILLLLIAFRPVLKAQDWAGLGRYHADNERLAQQLDPGDRVVFMGNSITDFWIRQSPEFFSGNDFIGRGLSGQTSPQMLLRFRADVIDLHARAVVLLAGTNDIAGNTGPSTLKMIEDNIESMVELAKANKIKVILCSLPPATGFKSRPPERIDSLNAWIKGYTTRQRLGWVDYYTALVDDQKKFQPKYSDDGLHPNKEGYRVMERLALPEVRRWVKKRK